MGFTDNWRYLAVGSFCSISIILLAVTFGFGSSDVNTSSDSAEHVINGANDFIIPAPFSEDNFQFKDSNNENNFMAVDYLNNSILIDKLDNKSFRNFKNSKLFNNRENIVDSSNYYYHKVSQADSTIPYLYKTIDVTNSFDYHTEYISYIEVIEVNGVKYRVDIGNCEGLNPVYESDIKKWENYLIKFNKINKVKTLKVI